MLMLAMPTIESK